MITVRKAAERGHANHGWLDTSHSFSFAEYHDPRYMGVGNLRVINEDRIAPGAGFGTHAHRDMEIVSYVLAGTLGHRDSLGQSAAIRPGDVQRMSAGRGIRHSEFNLEPNAETHFLQIWILPDELGIDPGYEQIRVADAEKQGRLRCIASPDGREGSVRLHADASIYAACLDGAQTARLALEASRLGYVQVARGSVSVNGIALAAGDGMRLERETEVSLSDATGAEVIVFDLAP